MTGLRRVWFTDDRRIEEVDTVCGALALVTPEALVALDAAALEPADVGPPTATVVLAGAALLVLAALVGIAVVRRSREGPRNR